MNLTLLLPPLTRRFRLLGALGFSCFTSQVPPYLFLRSGLRPEKRTFPKLISVVYLHHFYLSPSFYFKLASISYLPIVNYYQYLIVIILYCHIVSCLSSLFLNFFGIGNLLVWLNHILQLKIPCNTQSCLTASLVKIPWPHATYSVLQAIH